MVGAIAPAHDRTVRQSPGVQNQSTKESNRQWKDDDGRQTIYFRMETNSNDWKLEELKAPRL
jgi:hypothetical protein